MPYIPVAADLEVSSSTPHRFMGDIPDVDFSGFEQDLFGDNEGDLHYEGDNEDQVRLSDDSGDDKSPGMRAGDDEFSGMKALAMVPEVPEEVSEDIDEYQDLFEGYQSKSDDEYYAMLDVVESRPQGKLGSMRRRKFNLPRGPGGCSNQNEIAARVAEVVQMLESLKFRS
ncbi:hypothetical protein LWI29_035589 [Acer saccharum]|uniref:Uncharacterized protein n=1 Tax=Acer saccharum TaxID=4024 RepID=A0AA39UYF9_ACESA|nr:hypothetical protein LWI29_035589 [Acer saccharum]